MNTIATKMRTRQKDIESWFDQIWNPIASQCEKACCRLFSARVGITRMSTWPAGQRILLGPGDIWNSDIPDAMIRDLFMIMAAHPQHTFKVVTTNGYRMEQWFGTSACTELEVWLADAGVPWPLPWVMLGILARDQESLEDRIAGLLSVPAARRLIVIDRHDSLIDLTDITCPAEIYDASQVQGCTICVGNRELCRGGRFNALAEGISEVVLCDRKLDNHTVLLADEIADQCSLHLVPTIRIHR